MVNEEPVQMHDMVGMARISVLEQHHYNLAKILTFGPRSGRLIKRFARTRRATANAGHLG
jgi:hypothetical protein